MDISRATYISVTLMLLVLLLSVCSSARCEDIFLETFTADQELWDKSYIWQRGDEPFDVFVSGNDAVIFDHEGVFSYSEAVSSGSDPLWHLEGDLTVYSTVAVRGGKLYLRQYIKAGRPEAEYYHGIGRVNMQNIIEIEAPIISGLNHNSRLSMDLFLLDSGRFFGQYSPIYYNAQVICSLSTSSGTLIGGGSAYVDDDGNVGSFESFDVRISESLGYSDKEFDKKFGNVRSVKLWITMFSKYLSTWDRWGYEGVYLECAFDNIRIYQPCDPTGAFTYTPEKPMVGGQIKFDASSSDDPDGEIVEYEWNWGDGQSEILTHAETSHVFETPGVYTVTLTVTDNDGLTNDTSQELDLTLQKGDILLCRTDISFVPGKEWTHIGIYLGNEQVVEAVKGQGVITSQLSAWNWPEKTYVRALRVNTDVSTRQGAVNFALGKVGQPYDVGKIFLQRLGLTKKQVDSNNWYCSELIWAAYKHASNGAINLDQNRNGNAVAPDEIDGDNEVDIVGEHKDEKPETLWCWDRLWGGVAYCPVDLIVHDPGGLIISKQHNEIADAVYEEMDINEDGEADDVFAIPSPKIGEYLINVIPEANAFPTDTYGLEAAINGQTMVLAEDVQIQDIPSQPYEVVSKLCYSDFDVDGDVDFADHAVFASHWMDIDCNYPDWCGGADLDYTGVVDFNDLAIFVESWLWEKLPADIDIDGDIDFTDYALLASRWRYVDCNEPTWCFGADINKSGSVDLFDLAELAEHWLE